MRGVDQGGGFSDGLCQAGLIVNQLGLGKSVLQIAQQLGAIVADEEGGDATHALRDHDGSEGGVAIAETQDFPCGRIAICGVMMAPRLCSAPKIGNCVRSGTPTLAFKSNLEGPCVQKRFAEVEPRLTDARSVKPECR